MRSKFFHNQYTLLSPRMIVLSLLIVSLFFSFLTLLNTEHTFSQDLSFKSSMDQGVNPSPTESALSQTSESMTSSTSSSIHFDSNVPQLIILSDLIGYIEPCGCTIDLRLGGVEKVARWIREERAKRPTAFLVVGDHLFDSSTLPEHKVAQEESKAKLIREILSKLKVDAFTPGLKDLARGQSFYHHLQTAYPLPDVTANHQGGSPQILTLGKTKVGVFGLVPPSSLLSTYSVNSINSVTGQPSPLPATPLKESAQAAVNRLKEQGAQLIISLASLPRVEVRSLARSISGVDLWVLGDSPLEEAQLSPVEEQKSFIIEAGDRGRNLAQVKIFNASQSGFFADPIGDLVRRRRALDLKIKIKEKMSGMMPSQRMSARLIELKAERSKLETSTQEPLTLTEKRVEYVLHPIKKELLGAPDIFKDVQRYQESLKELNLLVAGQVKPLSAGENGYAGLEECSLCHPEAQSFWEKTEHSSAWKTLVKANKTYDVECVGCHVTGWQRAGGSALGHTKSLQDVQCEACHGPSSKHAEVGGGEAWTKVKVASTTCEGCHNHHHSPSFEYQRYLTKVIGPGHGQPIKETP